MPMKWTHLDFLVELIYNFMGWADMPDAPDEDEATQGTTGSRGAIVVRNDAAPASGVKHNLGNDNGRLAYWEKVKAYSVTVNKIDSNWFKDHMNGRYHPSTPNQFETTYCQYC